MHNFLDNHLGIVKITSRKEKGCTFTKNNLARTSMRQMNRDTHNYVKLYMNIVPSIITVTNNLKSWTKPNILVWLFKMAYMQ